MRMNIPEKILFVSQEYDANGSSISLLSLIRGMDEVKNRHIEITVLIPLKFKGIKQARDLFLANGIKVREMLYRTNYKKVGMKTPLIRRIHDIWNYLAVKKLCKYVKKSKFDLICSNSSAVDVGARAALLSHVQHIYYVREFMEEDHGFEYRNKKRMRRLLESSDYTIFISKAIEEKYKSLYKLQNTAQFYDGFIVNDYIINDHNILNNTEIRLIQLGSLCDGKGALNSVRLINELRRVGIENVHLDFVGNGVDGYKGKMYELIKKNKLEKYITILPYSSDIKEKLCIADILLMNSRSEGFGRVTIEGMLAGCLVVGRKAAGTAEIIQNDVNGLLYSDESEFVCCIKKILNNREKYKEVAKYAQNRAVKEFSCEKAAQNFMNVLRGYNESKT